MTPIMKVFEWSLRERGTWRRALGRRVLSEALIDEPWPWWSGEELKWRTGRFQVDNIYKYRRDVSRLV